MILEVDHVQITIPKGMEKEGREFYCDLLGLQEISKPENRIKKGGFWLTLNGVQVHVGTEDGVNRNATKAHIAYSVTDLEEWRKRLISKGFELKDSLPFPTSKAFEFRDPFGNRIELIQH